LAALVYLLKALEYRYFVRDLTLEFYLGLVAVTFMGVGVWIGLGITRRKKVRQTLQPFEAKQEALKETGISRREYEVLQLMAQGNSNQEIADKLFVSLNTVKTHSANLYAKLDAKRRTQAIQRAKGLRLLP
jgi:ATP/maltotriose-dependent transcriptional regulator MalT